MRILFVGNYDMAGSYLALRLYREGNRICWLTREKGKKLWDDHINGKVFRQEITYRTCRQIIQGEGIDCIFFLTGQYREAFLEEEQGQDSLVALIPPILQGAMSFSLKYICFLSSLDLRQEALLSPSLEELRAGERICSSFCRENGIPCLIFRLGSVFGDGEPDGLGFAGRILSSMERSKEVLCPYTGDSSFDFICGSDLADAVFRLINMDARGTFEIATGYPVSAKRLYEIAAEAAGFKGKTEFGSKVHEAKPEWGNRVKGMCGWMPFYLFENTGVAFLQKNWDTTASEQETKGGGRQAPWHKRHRVLSEILQNLVLLFIVELISNFSADWSDLRFVDVRLFYVILVAISFGMRQGMLATILASISYIWSLLNSGIDISYIFYSVESWIPFIIYGVAGAYAGYWSDKKNDEYDILESEFTEQRERYQFLKDLYREVVDVKNQLQKQIMISRASFSRIYEITEELGSLRPRVILSKTIRVMEEIMECDSVAIYLKPPDHTGYGRLMACSAAVGRSLPPSVDFKKLPRLMEAIEQKKIFVNKELDREYPAFAMPVSGAEGVIALAVIYELPLDKYTVYYKNLFQTLVQMVQNNLVRAYEYQEQNRERIYVPETNIFTVEEFEKELESLKASAEETGAVFSVGRLQGEGLISCQELYRRVRSLLRGTDILGIGRDGAVRAVFLYVDKANRMLLEKRFENNGFMIFWED